MSSRRPVVGRVVSPQETAAERPASACRTRVFFRVAVIGVYLLPSPAMGEGNDASDVLKQLLANLGLLANLPGRRLPL
jgi:hypothetical protein